MPSQSQIGEEVVEALHRLGLDAAFRTVGTDEGGLIVDGHRVAVEFEERAHPTPADLDRLRITPDVALVLVTDRLSDAGRVVLRERGVGWLDRRGHVRLWVPGVRVDAAFPPTAIPKRAVAVSFTPAVCELAFALLCDPSTKASPRRLGARLERSAGYLSTVLSTLTQEGLVDENGVAVVPELFWALNEAWPRDWVMLNDDPATVGPYGIVSGVHGAMAWGASVLVRDGDPVQVGLPDERALRRVLARATLSPARGRARSAVRELGPIGQLGGVRIGERRLAHPVLCALDLGADQRSRETLATWRARSVDVGVLGYLEVLALTGLGTYELVRFVESLALRDVESVVVWESVIAAVWTHPRALARLVDDPRLGESMRGVVEGRLRALAAEDVTAREVILSAPSLVLHGWWRECWDRVGVSTPEGRNEADRWDERLVTLFCSDRDEIGDGLAQCARDLLSKAAIQADTNDGVSFESWWALGPAFSLLRAQQAGVASLSEVTGDALKDLLRTGEQPTAEHLYGSWAMWSSGEDPAWKITTQRILRTRGRSLRSWLTEIDELDPEDRGAPLCALLVSTSPRQHAELVERIRRAAPAIRDLHLRAKVLSHAAPFAGAGRPELLRDAMTAARAAVEQTTPSLLAGPERGGIYGLLQVVARLEGSERRDALIETTDLWKRWVTSTKGGRGPDRHMLFHSSSDTTLPLVRWLSTETLCEPLRGVFETIRELGRGVGNALEAMLARGGRPALADGDVELVALFVGEARNPTEWAARRRDDDTDTDVPEESVNERCPFERAPFPTELHGYRNVWH